MTDVTFFLAVRENMDDATFRRGSHVINEIRRTIEFVDLFAKKEYKKAGELMFESHWSLSEKFEVSIKELDELVRLVTNFPGSILGFTFLF